MGQVVASSVLANGLRNDFADTYIAARNLQSDGRLGQVMDLGLTATNRQHEFAYFEAAPHMDYWRRGDTVPEDGFGSVDFTVPIYEWARRVRWSKFDRKDDQTSSLFDMARSAGQSGGLLPERFFFDLLTGTASTLPAIPVAPDGAVFFATTAGGSDRFGVTSGNLLTGTGITTISTVLADYYSAITQFMLFEDGKGQPMLTPEAIAAGVLIIHAAADQLIFDQAFQQVRQGVGLSATGVQSGTRVAAAAQSNVVQDASRNVELWASPRLATGDWYVFLKSPPKKSTFLLTREALQEFTSLESDNNSDSTRDTGIEYVQWEERSGAGIALPYGAIKVNN